ncbi:hypothetical protein GGX14DRAFT_385981 [Mycena pura]|uniref:Uncharacterized protein n=1 Tax=Mycena pura TaxID=153505 RepID=A0AAD7E4R1_9AGAR|nr:hypothetical protein GGX14DRAFT_385981 [Mycena pura]
MPNNASCPLSTNPVAPHRPDLLALKRQPRDRQPPGTAPPRMNVKSCTCIAQDLRARPAALALATAFTSANGEDGVQSAAAVTCRARAAVAATCREHERHRGRGRAGRQRASGIEGGGVQRGRVWTRVRRVEGTRWRTEACRRAWGMQRARGGGNVQMAWAAERADGTGVKFRGREQRAEGWRAEGAGGVQTGVACKREDVESGDGGGGGVQRAL